MPFICFYLYVLGIMMIYRQYHKCWGCMDDGEEGGIVLMVELSFCCSNGKRLKLVGYLYSLDNLV